MSAMDVNVDGVEFKAHFIIRDLSWVTALSEGYLWLTKTLDSSSPVSARRTLLDGGATLGAGGASTDSLWHKTLNAADMTALWSTESLPNATANK